MKGLSNKAQRRNLLQNPGFNRTVADWQFRNAEVEERLGNHRVLFRHTGAVSSATQFLPALPGGEYVVAFRAGSYSTTVPIRCRVIVDNHMVRSFELGTLSDPMTVTASIFLPLPPSGGTSFFSIEADYSDGDAAWWIDNVVLAKVTREPTPGPELITAGAFDLANRGEWLLRNAQVFPRLDESVGGFAGIALAGRIAQVVHPQNPGVYQLKLALRNVASHASRHGTVSVLAGQDEVVSLPFECTSDVYETHVFSFSLTRAQIAKRVELRVIKEIPEAPEEPFLVFWYIDEVSLKEQISTAALPTGDTPAKKHSHRRAGDNLLVNGDFGAGPSGWESGGGATIDVSALNLAISESNATTFIQQPNVPIDGPGEYVFSFRSQVATIAGPMKILLIIGPRMTAEVDVQWESTAPVTHEFAFDAPDLTAGPQMVKIVLLPAHGQGSWWMDDLVLAKAGSVDPEPGEDLLMNGDFDFEDAHWHLTAARVADGHAILDPGEEASIEQNIVVAHRGRHQLRFDVSNTAQVDGRGIVTIKSRQRATLWYEQFPTTGTVEGITMDIDLSNPSWPAELTLEIGNLASGHDADTIIDNVSLVPVP